MKKVVDKSGEIGYNNQRCQRESKDNSAILENDIVKTDKQERSSRRPRGREPERERTANSQISERDNGICQASSVKD